MPKLRTLLLSMIGAIAAFIVITPAALAFCGFYVSQADTSLYNQASQVVIARNGDRTVLTMANDYQGEVADFAMVVPVPTVLEESQVNVGDPAIMARLDSFSAPRLVEYFDPDPCTPIPPYEPRNIPLPSTAPSSETRSRQGDDALGVTVEAEFSVGEYDIVILSALESDGLETWLTQNNYRIPAGANELLHPYIRQGMKFFVAKVNLEAFDQSGFQKLRPLQMAYESSRFMLPIRLGMMNAQAEQDLVVYLLSPSGQVELTNYRTVKIPSDMDIPVFVKDEFADFYTSMFDTSHRRENREVAFLEYAWNMSGCDPCSANPLSPEELRQAGVFWVPPSGAFGNNRVIPQTNNTVFITRLHVRYDREHFPEDLMFQTTNNQAFFQGRYVMRHPFGGDLNCPAGQEYRRRLPQRLETEAQTLARLTGWDINDIRQQLPTVGEPPEPTPWWEDLWGQSGQLLEQLVS
jgi:hypothetical protein